MGWDDAVYGGGDDGATCGGGTKQGGDRVEIVES